MKEREWVPRLSAYVTNCNYSIYDESSGYASIPRYLLDELVKFLDNRRVPYEIINVPPVKPRQIKLKPKKGFCPRDNQHAIVDFMTSSAAYKPISAQTGIGKQCTNSTPIKIPGGWTTHGAVRVGDIVTAWDGTPSRVDGVFPQGLQQVFQVSFEDGRFVHVGARHLWTILYPVGGTLISLTVNTLELLSLLEHHNEIFIPLCESEIINDVALSMDPYAFGLFLIANSDCDPTPVEIQSQYNLALNASHEQRLALLQSFMDLGGSVSSTGEIRFATTVKAFVDVVETLVRSIGGICHTVQNAGNYVSNIRYRYPKHLFQLQKKRDEVSDIDQYEPNRRLRVSAVVPLSEKEECTCISIDHPDQLYVTKDFIVTHNTACAELAICKLGVTTLIVLNSLIDQWYKSLRQHIAIASHEIYVVQGIEPLKKLWEAIKNGYRPKVLIFSTRTLVYYGVNPKGPYAEMPSYAKLQEVLGIGLKIMDEVHLGFHANTRVDLVSNIAHNVYLSATYQRNHYQGRRIFDMVFPRELRFGEEFQKKFTTVHMLRYQLGIPPSDSQKMRSPKGYNHALYENYVRRNSKYFNVFMQAVVVPIIEMYFLGVRKPGQLMLILCQTRKFALRMEEYLKKWYGNRGSVAVYFSGEKGKNGADRNLLADLIISTHKSCGTGRDIKNLKSCLNTVSFASSPLTSQVLGRLREIPGEDTIFVDIWNAEVGSHLGHHNDRLDVYRNKALHVFEGILQ